MKQRVSKAFNKAVHTVSLFEFIVLLKDFALAISQIRLNAIILGLAFHRYWIEKKNHSSFKENC